MGVIVDDEGHRLADCGKCLLPPYGHGCTCKPADPPVAVIGRDRPKEPKAEPEPKPERVYPPKIYTPVSPPAPAPVVVLLREIRDLLKDMVKAK